MNKVIYNLDNGTTVDTLKETVGHSYSVGYAEVEEDKAQLPPLTQAAVDKQRALRPTI